MPRPGKVGSKAERDALRQEMLVGGCSLELIASEMERRWGFRPREAYRHAHGWSQDEVAARFTEVAERLGSERERALGGRPAAPQAPMIGTRIGEYERWPSGGRRPSPYVLTVLATVLGTTVERLLDYDDHRKMPDQERTVLAAVLAAATPPLPAPVTPGSAGRLPSSAGPARDDRSQLPGGGIRRPAAGRSTEGLVAPGRTAAGPGSWPDDADQPRSGSAHDTRAGGAWAASADEAGRPSWADRPGWVAESDPAADPDRGAGTDHSSSSDRSIEPGQMAEQDWQAAQAGSTRTTHPSWLNAESDRTAESDGEAIGTARTELTTESDWTVEPNWTVQPSRAARSGWSARHPWTPESDWGTAADWATPEWIQEAAEDSPAGGAVLPAQGDRTDPETHPYGSARRLPRRVRRAVPPPLSETPLIAVTLDPSAPDAAAAARRHRRDRLLIGSPVSALSDEEVLMEAAGQSAEFGEWAEGTNVGSTTLEQLDDDVRRIARDYLNNAPLPLMLATLRVRNRVFTLLEGRQHPRQTSHLYVAAGRLCGLLAWMASDVGRHAEAETQARTGWLCAELAGADGLRAWIRATQSKVAYWDGQVRESARLAEDGLRFAAPDTARVLLASLAARAWARLGNADSAHAALALAEDERGKAGVDEVGGLFGFSEAQQNYLAGTTHLWLRESAQALEASNRAVWLYEVGAPSERFYGAEMLALMDAATAHVQGDELDGAADKLRPVLALPADQRLETFTLRLGELRESLRRSRHAVSRPAVDMQQQIEDFRTGALGQYLRR